MYSGLSAFFYLISIGGLVLIVQSTPVKVSRPQAITAKNLTQEQIESLIQENPPRPSILQPSDQFLPPSIPFYLPDPDRNKTKDDYPLLAAYTHDEKPIKSENQTKIVISLDTYARPPPIPDFQNTPIAEQLQQAENDKTSYSYNNRFDYYFPVRVVYDSNERYADRELQLMKMHPPIQNDEPNYYDTKPKKIPKKYQPNKKDVNHGKSNDDELIQIDNDGLVLADEQSAFVTSQPVERFAPAPSFHRLTDYDLNTGEYIPKQQHKYRTEANLQTSDDTASASSFDTFERHIHHSDHSGESNSKDNDFEVHDTSVNIGDDYQKSETDTEAKRMEFQLHGFKGPNSYRFGYDTGHGKERQFRTEQREEDGSVTGEYGYIDYDGKMHLTKYSASEAKGFKSEQIR